MPQPGEAEQAETQDAQQAEGAEQVAEETPAESAEQGQEEGQAEGAEAKPEGEESAEAGEEPAEGEEEEPKDGAATEAKQKRATGWQRKISKLERQVAEKDAMLAQILQRLPQSGQGGAEPAKKTPEQEAVEQFNKLVQKGVQETLMAERQAAEQRALVEEWHKQMPPDEEEAYEVRQGIAEVQGFPDGPFKVALLTSKHLPKIIKELQRNPQEVARLSALPEARRAAEIGRFEERFSSGAAPARPPTPAKRPPPPPSKVAGSASGTRRWDELPLAEQKRLARSKGR